MRLALVFQTLAIFIVTSLVRCAPVENQVNEIVERDTEFCTRFYEHVHFQGLNTFLCDKQKKCLPVPSFGVSSIKPNPSSCGYCQFYKQTGCDGGFIGISTTDTIADLTEFSVKSLNWNDVIKSYWCDEKLNCGAASNNSTGTIAINTVHQVEEMEVRSSIKLAERDSCSGHRDTLCVAMWKDAGYSGEMNFQCSKSNCCKTLDPLDLEVSSLKIGAPYTMCYFYDDVNCMSDKFIRIMSGWELSDLSNWLGTGQDFNDRILSQKCLKLDQSQILPPKRDVSDISARTPTQDGGQTSTDRIDVTLYEDTHFDGVLIDLSAKVNACVKITKSDGTGHNFGMSSARINTRTTTSDGHNNVAYCKFYKGKDCEETTWAFTIGNQQDALDLNDISQLKSRGPEQNVNDKIWSTYCLWDAEVRRRDLSRTTPVFSQVPAPKPEVPGPHPTEWIPGIPYGMLLYPEPDFKGDPVRAWSEPGQCYWINYSGPWVGLFHPLWSYGSIKMDRLPEWILDMGMDIKCHFNRASNCEYPSFSMDSWHDISHVEEKVNGYWCEWRQTTLSRPKDRGPDVVA